MKRRTFLALSAGTFCELALADLRAAGGCDLIVYNGKIVTVDESFSIRQAMAITGNTIVAVGDNDQVIKLKGPRTEIVDLKGRMVLPGLIDSHAHSNWACAAEVEYKISEMNTIQDVLDYVKQRTKVVPQGEWIVVERVFVTRIRERRYPTKAELDRVAPKHPVLFLTSRDGVLNSLGLKEHGMDRDFEVTDGGPGYIEKDPVTGEPTGIVRGCRRILKIITGQRRATKQEQYDLLVKLFKDYNSVGLTGTCDGKSTDSNLALYKKMLDNKELTVRMVAQKGFNTLGPIGEVVQRIKAIKNDEFYSDNPMLRVIGAKVFLDGGMLTGTALMRKPWGLSKMYAITDPEYKGIRRIPHERLVPMVRAAIESGMQFNCHTVGDGAVHAMLDAYEEVNKTLPVRKTRSTVIHVNFMSAESIEMIKRMGILTMVQPAWMYLDTAALESHFGKERMKYFQPWRTLFDEGILAAGGSDHMYKIGSLRSVNPYDPFLAMWTVVARKPKWYKGRFNPHQCLTREQAIRLYTSNSAWSMFQEKYVGSLETGKLADFIVLDTDLLTCPEDGIRDAKVLRTYLNGKVVFKRATV